MQLGRVEGQQCPPPPPPSPQQQQQQQQQLDIANLLQFAQSSYVTNPTDALSALMNALDLTTGSDDASRRAIDRIRSQLGEAVAARVVVGERRVDDADQPPGGCEETIHRRGQRDRQQPSCFTVPSMSNEHQQMLTEKEMTLRAMEMVQEMLKDTSTFLYSQGREHILQQAMEDGSSIICSNCGNMISRERWKQHAEYWCRELKLSDSNDDGDCVET